MALTTTGMVLAIEDALRKEWQKEKKFALPTIGQDDRRLLFAAIARGVLEYLDNNQNEIFKSITVRDAAGYSRYYIVERTDFNFSKGT